MAELFCLLKLHSSGKCNRKLMKTFGEKKERVSYGSHLGTNRSSRITGEGNQVVCSSEANTYIVCTLIWRKLCLPSQWWITVTYKQPRQWHYKQFTLNSNEDCCFYVRRNWIGNSSILPRHFPSSILNAAIIAKTLSSMHLNVITACLGSCNLAFLKASIFIPLTATFCFVESSIVIIYFSSNRIPEGLKCLFSCG